MSGKQPASSPTAVTLDAGLADIAAMGIEELRGLWRRTRGGDPPDALSKDLIARALAHWLQEQHIGGLSPRIRKLLAAAARDTGTPARQVKVGSVIVREYQGKLHEVLVVPEGFCWRGQVYASLSLIAQTITGTSWNGPRFFGLRGGEAAPTPKPVAPAGDGTAAKPFSRSRTIRARSGAPLRGGVA
jgi:hypothetical protein